jgi:hypothetical protein
LNRASPNNFRRSSAPERRAARLPTPPRACAHHLGVRAAPAPSRGAHAFPRLSRATRMPRVRPSSRRVWVGRRAPDGPPDGPVFPCCSLLPRPARAPMDVAMVPCGRLQAPLAAHKRGTTLTLRHAHGRAAAGATDGSHGEAPVPAGAGPNKPPPHLPLHMPKLTGVASPPQPHHTACTAGRGGHCAWPPAPPLAGLLPAPSKNGNRSPRTQGPSPARARPAPDDGWPEFCQTATAGRPGATLQRADSFQGLPRKNKTSIVFAVS